MSSTKILLPNGTEYEQPIGLFINNEYIGGTGDSFEVIDPSIDKPILSLKGASTADVDTAVSAARKAFDEGPWSEINPKECSKQLFKLAAIIDQNRSLIAAIDAYDLGKPYEAALAGDLDESVNVFEYYAGWADKIDGKSIETSVEKLCYTVQEPLGVCAQIIPWNFPFMMLAWKVAPALACGNVVVLKPAEQTPLSAMFFGKLVQEAGFPPGVVNILPGIGSVTGKALAEHHDVDKIAFTGSTATGRSIMRSAASNLKNITLECGGKSPLIVFEDAELENAVHWAHVGIMDNSGQVCTSTSRIYVQERIYDSFVKAFTAYTERNAHIGGPFEEGVTHGPQVSRVQSDKVVAYMEQATRDGAKAIIGGHRLDRDGYFIEPTVFVNADEKSTIVKEEVFGPVVTISSFNTDADAIAKANDSPYGLAAALFTEKVSRAHRVARRLKAGMVWINSSGDSHYGIPFGGYKSSGIGRELGSYALDAYTQTKAVHVNLAM
ncbi:hypothetical protein M409DRAFT_66865 [Zasmidium cellare ATCC 36951]|uniref:aldehyde dehydrogenase (NAD(+)) n=1 Tax=Zasmidium cellare ATCC 36951 TaxID=1080233 RepID=A0A6A6CJM4_ZASCE|nr:uncharacterized protein M409DRAFT_66865 [Zasmidium cellare ATCC 36951]KAF2165909.1 hypothetical protein M409DRAFT_66865 [Zasmidium cellare ATCC 36951]